MIDCVIDSGRPEGPRRNRMLRTRGMSVTVALLAVGAAAVPAVTAAGTAAAGSTASTASRARPVSSGLTGFEAHAAREPHSTAQSRNWSGYVKSGNGFTSAAAEFTVPTLKTTYPGYSSTWVGIGGASASDQYLIQTGIEADVAGGRAGYYAWYEVITPTDPAPEVRFTTVPVKAGDVVSAKVAKGTTGTWTITFTDATTKKSATHATAFAGPGKSAEWIEEDTDVNGYISTAPDWQKVGFSACTANGVNPALTSAQAVNIVSPPGLLGGLLGGRPIQETSTSAPNSTRNGFSVTWLATGQRSRA